MKKQLFAIMLILCLVCVPVVSAFSIGEMFSDIGDWFKGLFGKKVVGSEGSLTVQCTPGDACAAAGGKIGICAITSLTDEKPVCVSSGQAVKSLDGKKYYSFCDNAVGGECDVDVSDGKFDAVGICLPNADESAVECKVNDCANVAPNVVCWNTAESNYGTCNGGVCKVQSSTVNTCTANDGICLPSGMSCETGIHNGKTYEQSSLYTCPNDDMNGLNQKCCVFKSVAACTGTTPANAVLCADSNQDLSEDTAIILSSSCTGAKCEYQCVLGYTYNPTTKVCDKTTTTPCVGLTPSATTGLNGKVCKTSDNKNGLCSNGQCLASTICDVADGTKCIKDSVLGICGVVSLASATPTCFSSTAVLSNLKYYSFCTTDGMGCDIDVSDGKYSEDGQCQVGTCVPGTFVQCTGKDLMPANTIRCSNDETGLTAASADKTALFSNVCTDARKCEYICALGYVKSGSSCVQEGDSALSMCTLKQGIWLGGTIKCCGDDTNENYVTYMTGTSLKKGCCNTGEHLDKDGSCCPATKRVDDSGVCTICLDAETNFANGIDDDCDGAKDGYDTDATTKKTIKLSDVVPSASELNNKRSFYLGVPVDEIICKFTTSTANDYANASNCMRLDIDGVACSTKEVTTDGVKFKDCKTKDQIKEQTISCSVAPNCNIDATGSRSLITKINVTDYQYCDDGERGSGNISIDTSPEVLVSDDSLDCSQTYCFSSNDTIDLEVYVAPTNDYYNIEDTKKKGMTIYVQAILYDITNDRKLNESNVENLTFEYKDDDDTASLHIQVPSKVYTDDLHAIYVKAYKKGSESNICKQAKIMIGAAEGDEDEVSTPITQSTTPETAEGDEEDDTDETAGADDESIGEETGITAENETPITAISFFGSAIGIIIAIVVLVLIGGGLGLFFYLKNKNKGAAGTQQTGGNDALDKYVADIVKKGFTKDQVSDKLLKSGWTQQQIDSAFSKIK